VVQILKQPSTRANNLRARHFKKEEKGKKIGPGNIIARVKSHKRSKKNSQMTSPGTPTKGKFRPNENRGERWDKMSREVGGGGGQERNPYLFESPVFFNPGCSINNNINTNPVGKNKKTGHLCRAGRSVSFHEHGGREREKLPGGMWRLTVQRGL